MSAHPLKNSTVLVTGGTGLIGSHIVDCLAEAKARYPIGLMRTHSTAFPIRPDGIPRPHSPPL